MIDISKSYLNDLQFFHKIPGGTKKSQVASDQ